MKLPEIDHEPVAKAVAQLLEEDRQYGDILTREWLQEAFNVTPPESGTAQEFQKYAFQWLGLMDEFRGRLLVEHSMMLLSVRGQGYVIVRPEEQTAVALDTFFRTVANAYSKAQTQLRHVNHDALDEKQRAENLDAQARVAAMESATSDERKRIQNRLRKH